MALKTKSVPVYLRAQQFIEELLESKDYGPGDHIPSERALAEELGINRLTARKAIDRLVQAGRLERNSTAGTRIPQPRITRPVDAHSSGGITRVIQLSGGVPGNRLLHFELSPASEAVAKHLKIEPGTELVVFRRLWTVNDTPFCIETSHIPASRVPGLAAEDLVAGQSLYALLEARYGIKTGHGTRTIGVNTPTKFEVEALQLPSHSSTLLLRMVVSDGANVPMEYMRSVNHPAHVIFQAN
ncbi:GntR family transcriptional regulator [Devosia sp.]|uniref:GntR family transcriptional regulator n=1 Tax=Devosia sp. TaxID=1871048 RepID=UPI0035B3CFDE